MVKIIEHLYTGSIAEYQSLGLGVVRFSVLGACKEPLHRMNARIQGAEENGYTGRSMAKYEPEYLWAERNHALYLNLIDARKPEFIPVSAIKKAIEFISEEIKDGRDVFIVCNKGESRSPSIALIYLIELDCFDDCNNFDEVIYSFKNDFFRNYNPGVGMYEFCKKWWEDH